MSYFKLPIEISYAGIYFPPLLLACTLGLVLAWCATRLLNKYGLVRYIWYPPLFYLALIVIFSCLAGIFVFPT